MTNAILKSLSSRRNLPRYTSSKSENNCFTNLLRVDVEFLNLLPMEQVVSILNQHPNPQVITWYIGYHGLRSAGVQFYRDFLISPGLESHPNITFWLVDLTAWSAFKNPRCSMHTFNRACEIIESVPNRHIRCIKSATIFEKMQKLADKDILDYFKRALRRSFISASSQHFPDNNIRTGDVFSGNCPLIAEWYECDASKSYSVLQYLEGCFLVEEVFMQEVANGEDKIQIIFILPNDEFKYYQDNQHSFQKDIQFLISKRCSTFENKNVQLSVKFLPFKYGTALNDRPYNAPGKVLKNNNLSYLDIIGDLGTTALPSRTKEVYAPDFK